MRRDLIMLYARILEACRNHAKVSVLDEKSGVVVEGVARNIVDHSSTSFATDLTPESRLWITGKAEFFIPLGNITDEGFYTYGG